MKSEESEQPDIQIMWGNGLASAIGVYTNLKTNKPRKGLFYLYNVLSLYHHIFMAHNK
ncbi:hypothetical protein [Salmonella phage Se_EM4]|nr:hypothetical protein [Salmonella phage Se_EM4]